MLYNIPDTHSINVAKLLSDMSPTQSSWTQLLQPATYTMHVGTLPSSIPPTQFTRRFRREHLRLVYFRFQVHLRLFSFNQGSTSAADVKWGQYPKLQGNGKVTLLFYFPSASKPLFHFCTPFTHCLFIVSLSSYLAASTDFPDSLAIRLYHLPLLAGLLEHILCPYRTAVDKF